jgi:thiamine-phosphate pyrophosphorylase
MFGVNAAFAARRPLLYLVTDPRNLTSAQLVSHVKRCLDGGVDVVQLRDKKCSDEEFERTARELLRLTQDYGVPLVINDRVHIARRIGAPSIHVGRKDGKLEDLIRDLAPETYVGFSVDGDNLDDPIPAGAHLLGVGPVWATSTKKDAALPMGIDNLRKVIERTTLPVVAIGGINHNTIRDCVRVGCAGVAIVGELMDASDPTATAKELKAIMVEEAALLKSRERDTA